MNAPPDAPSTSLPEAAEPELASLRPLVRRAVLAAGLGSFAARSLRGEPSSPDDRARLEGADLLAVAALADALRERACGDEVWLVDGHGVSTLRSGRAVRWVTPALGGAEGVTGIEALREVAVARLLTPPSVSIGVSWDVVGFELAQVALLFGADVLGGMPRRKGGLPVLDPGARAARREEIASLVARAGRRPRWCDEVGPDAVVAAESAEPVRPASARSEVGGGLPAEASR
jgi:hypothetical protein